MKRAFRARWAAVALAVLGLGLAAQPVLAIEFWDERIQVHGFFETRMSFGYEDFNSTNKIDMYGWLQVLNVEIEAEIAPDGWGPFDMIAAFARIEVKYDCVWNHACGTLPQVNAFGNQPKNLPHRVQSGQREGLAGSQVTFDRRPWWFADRERLGAGEFYDTKAGQRASKSFVYGSTNVGPVQRERRTERAARPVPRHPPRAVRRPLPGGVGSAMFYDGNWTNPFTELPGDDDAGLYLFNRTSHCRVGNWEIKDSSLHGFGQRELIWGIDGCHVRPTGFTRFVANPFADNQSRSYRLRRRREPGAARDRRARSPRPDGIPVNSQLPLRPGPEHGIGSSGEKAPRGESQGIFVPDLKNRLAAPGRRLRQRRPELHAERAAVEPRREPEVPTSCARPTSSSRPSRAGSGCAPACRPSCGARPSCSATRTSGTRSTSRSARWPRSKSRASRSGRCAASGRSTRWGRSRTCGSSWSGSTTSSSPPTSGAAASPSCRASPATSPTASGCTARTAPAWRARSDPRIPGTASRASRPARASSSATTASASPSPTTTAIRTRPTSRCCSSTTATSIP